MPEEYVDRAYLDIDGTTIECTEITPKDSCEVAPVETMNPLNRAIGYTSGIPKYEISATVPLPQGGHAVNFRKAMRDKTEFTTTILYVGGKSITYLRCRITDVEQGSEQGSRTDTKLTILALDTGDN